MSARAAVRLQELWQDLRFFVVDHTVAHEPVSEQDRERRSFHGFTADGIPFDSDRHRTLSFDGGGDPPLQFVPGGAQPISESPAPGQLICGVVEDTAEGRRLSRWFVCDEAFRLLVQIVREGNTHSEDELGRLLRTTGFRDTYWAVARLVFFDDVQAFVDCIGTGGTMSIGFGFSRFVHELAHLLDMSWWEAFEQLAIEQGVLHGHPGRNGDCHACVAAGDGDRFRLGDTED